MDSCSFDNYDYRMQSLAQRYGFNLIFFFLLIGLNVTAGPGESTKSVAERMEYAHSIKMKAVEQNDSSLLAESHYLYGKAFAVTGDYITSQRYFLNSLLIQQALKDSARIARLYVRLSGNEVREKHYQDAMRYARTALEISKRIGVNVGMGGASIALNALGAIHEQLWEIDSVKNAAHYDSAYQRYREIEHLMIGEKNRTGIADANWHLGRLLYKKGDRRCFAYLEQALVVFEDEKMYSDCIYIQIGRAMASLRFGQLPLAFKRMKAAQHLYEDSQLQEIPTLLAMYQGFIDYYRAIDSPDSTIVYMERLHQVQLSLASLDRKTILEWLHREHFMQTQEKEMDQNKRLIALQATNLLLQKKLVLFLCLVSILAIVTGIFFFFLNKRNRRTSQLNAQLVQEQSHRIRNNLQAVSGLLQLQSRSITDPAAQNAIADSKLRVQAIALLQKRLYDESLGPEVNLNTYLTELTDQVLTVFGFSQIHKTVEIDNTSISPEKALPIALILNELITNACKYAFADHPAPRLVLVCKRVNNHLSLIVSDNGPGFVPISGQSPKSFGLQLIHMQVRQLYAHCIFEISENGKGTKFSMDFTV